MKNVFRRLADILATLIGLNANQRIVAVLLTVAGIIALDWFSNGALALLDGEANLHRLGFWLQMLTLPLVLVLFYIVTRTVTMSAGMTLYCALTRRSMQYTATTLDPTKGKPLDTPRPYGIRINYDPIQRSVLRQLLSEEASTP